MVAGGHSWHQGSAVIQLSVPVGQVTEACCPITLQGWPSLSTLCLLRRQKVRGGGGGSREEGPVRASGGHRAGRCTTHGPRRVWKQVCLHRKGRSSKDDQPTQEGPRLGSAVGEGSTKKARGFPRQRTCRLQEVIELLPQHPIYSLSFPHCSYGRGSRLKGGSTCSPPSTQGCWEH